MSSSRAFIRATVTSLKTAAFLTKKNRWFNPLRVEWLQDLQTSECVGSLQRLLTWKNKFKLKMQSLSPVRSRNVFRHQWGARYLRESQAKEFLLRQLGCRLCLQVLWKAFRQSQNRCLFVSSEKGNKPHKLLSCPRAWTLKYSILKSSTMKKISTITSWCIYSVEATNLQMGKSRTEADRPPMTEYRNLWLSLNCELKRKGI